MNFERHSKLEVQGALALRRVDQQDWHNWVIVVTVDCYKHVSHVMAEASDFVDLAKILDMMAKNQAAKRIYREVKYPLQAR